MVNEPSRACGMVQISSSSDGSRKLRSKRTSVTSIVAPFLLVVVMVASAAVYLTFRFNTAVRLLLLFDNDASPVISYRPVRPCL
jgi:hypothetical protein